MFNKSGLVNQMVKFISDESLEIGRNPVAWREYVRHARGKSNRFVRITFLITAGLSIATFLLLFSLKAVTCSTDQFCELGTLGAALEITSGAFLLYQLMAVILLVPIFLATSVGGERTHNTLELLLTTTLTSAQIINGKVTGALPYIVLMILPAGLGFIGPLFLEAEATFTLAVLSSQIVILINTAFILALAVFFSIRFNSPSGVLTAIFLLMALLQVAVWFLPLFFHEVFELLAEEMWYSLSFTGTMLMNMSPPHTLTPSLLFEWVLPILAHLLIYGLSAFSLYCFAIHRLNQLRG